jgi:predicted O-linked N-acetylglucosamine transferase (SPINDLY family)
LPDTFASYNPLTTEPQVNALPADTNGWVTFGCLNNFCKVNDAVLSVWGQTLRAIPNSRLLLLCPRGDHRREVIGKLSGVAPDRIELIDRVSREEYLRLYHRIDLCLDTFPYNGITTTLDAYWMGVPTVSLCGTTAVSRAGFSQATNLGLTEFVTNSPQQFVQIGLALAGDRARLRELRATLRSRLEASPLMDGKRFAGEIEKAYRDIWRRWCEKG